MKEKLYWLVYLPTSKKMYTAKIAGYSLIVNLKIMAKNGAIQIQELITLMRLYKTAHNHQ